MRYSAIRNLRVPEDDVRVIYNSIDQATLVWEAAGSGRIKEGSEHSGERFCVPQCRATGTAKGQPVLLRVSESGC